MSDQRAKVWKQGTRWHWYIIDEISSGIVHVYQGHESTWRLAMAMCEFQWHIHVLHNGLGMPPFIYLGSGTKSQLDIHDQAA